MVTDTFVRWRHDTLRIISPSNLVKGFDCFVVVVVVFFPSATWLFPSHLSLFSIFRFLRTVFYIKEGSVRGIHKGRYWKEEELHFASSFLPIAAFLDKFIVSSELDGAALRYHQRLEETNTETRHFFAHLIVKFKNRPKERASGRVRTIALLPYSAEQRSISMDFKSDMTRQDSLLQKSLCLWDHNQQHHRASACMVILPLNRVTSVFWRRLLIE